MKNYISALFFLLILTACNTKNDTKPENLKSDYFTREIGTNNAGKYVITNADITTIEEEWESKIEHKLGIKDVELKDFKIVKGETQGDAVEDYYLLISKTADDSIMMAAIVELKGNKFFFDVKTMGDVDGYQTIICKGTCEKGCDPIVRLQNGLKSLNCSACSDCEKTDSEMY